MYNKCTKNIDLSKLTDAEIIDRFGPAAPSIIQLKKITLNNQIQDLLNPMIS